MPCRQLLRCLKTDLKKTKGKIGTLFFVTSLFLPHAAASLEVGAELYSRQDSIYVTIHSDDFPGRQVLDAIDRGFRSEILFTIKVYREKGGLLSFLRNDLQREKEVAYTAGWDVFEQVYFVLSGSGGRQVYQNSASFIDSLTRLEHCNLEIDPRGSGTLYALVHITVRPVRLSPPLTIINVLQYGNVIESSWIRVEL